MCISLCICLAGFTWPAVTKKRSGVPTPPRCISSHVDDTACGKYMTIKPVLPPSFTFPPFFASSQGPTLNCLPCPVRCNLTTPSFPPPPDAIILQGEVLPQHTDSPRARLQNWILLVLSPRPQHQSALQTTQVLACVTCWAKESQPIFCKGILEGVKTKEYVTQNSL